MSTARTFDTSNSPVRQGTKSVAAYKLRKRKATPELRWVNKQPVAWPCLHYAPELQCRIALANPRKCNTPVHLPEPQDV